MAASSAGLLGVAFTGSYCRLARTVPTELLRKAIPGICWVQNRCYNIVLVGLCADFWLNSSTT